MAVTTDFAAAEFDTRTGERIRPIAQLITAEELASSPETRNGISDVWRLADGSFSLVSSCCEPAAGAMFWIDQDDPPITPANGDDLYDLRGSHGWFAEAAPSGAFAALSGVSLFVTSPDGALAWSPSQLPPREFLTPPAWSWDLARLYGLIYAAADSRVRLAVAEIDRDLTYSIDLTWWKEAANPSGLAMTANGTLVSFETSADQSTQEVIFNPDGTLIETTSIGAGSHLGGIDPTGQFLIYVDGQGNARWRDLGGNGGLLGTALITASW